MLQNLVAPNL